MLKNNLIVELPMDHPVVYLYTAICLAAYFSFYILAFVRFIKFERVCRQNGLKAEDVLLDFNRGYPQAIREERVKCYLAVFMLVGINLILIFRGI